MNARCKLDTVLLLVVRRTVEKKQRYMLYSNAKSRECSLKVAGSCETRRVKSRPERRQWAQCCLFNFVDGWPSFKHPQPTFKISKFDRGNYIENFDNLYSPPYWFHVVPVSSRNAPFIYSLL